MHCSGWPDGMYAGKGTLPVYSASRLWYQFHETGHQIRNTLEKCELYHPKKQHSALNLLRRAHKGMAKNEVTQLLS